MECDHLQNLGIFNLEILMQILLFHLQISHQFTNYCLPCPNAAKWGILDCLTKRYFPFCLGGVIFNVGQLLKATTNSRLLLINCRSKVGLGLSPSPRIQFGRRQLRIWRIQIIRGKKDLEAAEEMREMREMGIIEGGKELRYVAFLFSF